MEESVMEGAEASAAMTTGVRAPAGKVTAGKVMDDRVTADGMTTRTSDAVTALLESPRP